MDKGLRRGSQRALHCLSRVANKACVIRRLKFASRRSSDGRLLLLSAMIKEVGTWSCGGVVLVLLVRGAGV